VIGGAIGALTGASIGHDVDRANAYYYGGYYYTYPPPPPPPGYYETRTVVQNPDGSTTTYINRYPAY
jgi:hypothetical protein